MLLHYAVNGKILVLDHQQFRKNCKKRTEINYFVD